MWAFHGRTDRIVPVNASRDIVNALAAARNLLPNVASAPPFHHHEYGLPEGHGGIAHDTTDVAVGLRYTELLDASHYKASAAPLFDKTIVAPLFEWTLGQLRAAGFDQHRALRYWAKSPREPRRTRDA